MAQSSTQFTSGSVVHSQHDADALNRLLRGEISAAETYDKAIEKFSSRNEPMILGEVTRIRDEHHLAVSVLRERIQAFGGQPSEGSGVWGAFANAVAGTAKALGPQTLLEALKQGELSGIDDYRNTAAEQELSSECRYLIRSELLPRCQEHVRSLDIIIDQLQNQENA